MRPRIHGYQSWQQLSPVLFREAANSVRRHIPEYQAYYAKKYAEVPKHQHKRALALTSRKLVRLVFGLLAKNQLYTGEQLDAEPNKESN